MNEKHLIDFNVCKVFRLCDIKKIKPYENHGEDSTNYCIRIKLKGGKYTDIYFPNEKKRNEWQKIIFAAADFADDQ